MAIYTFLDGKVELNERKQISVCLSPVQLGDGSHVIKHGEASIRIAVDGNTVTFFLDEATVPEKISLKDGS